MKLCMCVGDISLKQEPVPHCKKKQKNRGYLVVHSFLVTGVTSEKDCLTSDTTIRVHTQKCTGKIYDAASLECKAVSVSHTLPLLEL